MTKETNARNQSLEQRQVISGKYCVSPYFWNSTIDDINEVDPPLLSSTNQLIGSSDGNQAYSCDKSFNIFENSVVTRFGMTYVQEIARNHVFEETFINSEHLTSPFKIGKRSQREPSENVALAQSTGTLLPLKNMVNWITFLQNKFKYLLLKNRHEFSLLVTISYMLILMATIFANKFFDGLHGFLNEEIIYTLLVAFLYEMFVFYLPNFLVKWRPLKTAVQVVVGLYFFSILFALREEGVGVVIKKLGVLIEVSYNHEPPPI